MSRIFSIESEVRDFNAYTGPVKFGDFSSSEGVGQ